MEAESPIYYLHQWIIVPLMLIHSLSILVAAFYGLSLSMRPSCAVAVSVLSRPLSILVGLAVLPWYGGWLLCVIGGIAPYTDCATSMTESLYEPFLSPAPFLVPAQSPYEYYVVMEWVLFLIVTLAAVLLWTKRVRRSMFWTALLAAVAILPNVVHWIEVSGGW